MIETDTSSDNINNFTAFPSVPTVELIYSGGEDSINRDGFGKIVSFNSSSSNKINTNESGGKINVTCKHCPQKFKHRTNLYRHYVNVHKDTPERAKLLYDTHRGTLSKPFRCHTCPTSFQKYENYHFHIHTLHPTELQNMTSESQSLVIEEMELDENKDEDEMILPDEIIESDKNLNSSPELSISSQILIEESLIENENILQQEDPLILSQKPEKLLEKTGERITNIVPIHTNETVLKNPFVSDSDIDLESQIKVEMTPNDFFAENNSFIEQSLQLGDNSSSSSFSSENLKKFLDPFEKLKNINISQEATFSLTHILNESLMSLSSLNSEHDKRVVSQILKDSFSSLLQNNSTESSIESEISLETAELISNQKKGVEVIPIIQNVPKCVEEEPQEKCILKDLLLKSKIESVKPVEIVENSSNFLTIHNNNFFESSNIVNLNSLENGHNFYNIKEENENQEALLDDFEIIDCAFDNIAQSSKLTKNCSINQLTSENTDKNATFLNPLPISVQIIEIPPSSESFKNAVGSTIKYYFNNDDSAPPNYSKDSNLEAEKHSVYEKNIQNFQGSPLLFNLLTDEKNVKSKPQVKNIKKLNKQSVFKNKFMEDGFASHLEKINSEPMLKSEKIPVVRLERLSEIEIKKYLVS